MMFAIKLLFYNLQRKLGSNEKFVVSFVYFIDVFGAVKSPIHNQMNLLQVQKVHVCQHVPYGFDVGGVGSLSGNNSFGLVCSFGWNNLSYVVIHSTDQGAFCPVLLLFLSQ